MSRTLQGVGGEEQGAGKSKVCPRHVFWLFGLSGAGKSTLATLLIEELRRRGVSVLALDGDVLRSGLCKGLGFSDEDRAENLRRAAEAARLGLQSGLFVVASFITPLESHRRLVAKILDPNLSFVHVSAPVEVCQARDVKGLYAGAKAGKVTQMTGISAKFEPPSRMELTLETAQQSVDSSGRELIEFARQRLNSLRATAPAF